MIKAGVPHEGRAAGAGHSSYAITADTYSHVNIEQQRDAAEQLRKASRGDRATWLHGWLHSADLVLDPGRSGPRVANYKGNLSRTGEI